MNSPVIKKFLVCMILLSLTFFSPILLLHADEPTKPPEEPKPSATISVDFLNQYIFRGTAQSKDSAVMQPSFTASYSGFSANIWGNFDASRHSNNPFLPIPRDQRGDAKWSETDFTLSYTREICKDFSFVVGDVYYSLSNPFPFDLNEVFGGLTYNFPWFGVAFTAYREVTHSPGWWFQLDVTKSIPLEMLCKGTSLDLGASFGYLILDDKDTLLNLSGATGSFSDFDTAQLTAALKIPVYRCVTVAPKIGFWLPLTGASSRFLEANSFDKNDTHLYGGINLTASF